VAADTSDEQIPWTGNGLIGDFCFDGCSNISSVIPNVTNNSSNENSFPSENLLKGDDYYFNKNDWQMAIIFYKKSAEEGNPMGMAALAKFYKSGYREFEKDESKADYFGKKALQPLQKLAETGDMRAQYYLGNLYYNLLEDYEIASKWYLKAAKQGFAMAQNNLGSMYRKGEGVPQDHERAIYWYRKAAEQNLALGQNSLGWVYYRGVGIPKDYEQAIYWFRKAAEQNLALGQNILAKMYHHGDGVPKDYEQAVYWYRKAAEQSFAPAQSHLGFMYSEGIGVPEDDEQAVYWYRKAANQGYAPGQNNLASTYYYGYGVPKDYEHAAYWYRKAAEQGFAHSQYQLANMYYYGYGISKDYEQAIFWYRKAAEQDIALAQDNLAKMYSDGNGVSKDIEQAIYWFRKAAEQGLAQGQYHLSAILSNRDGGDDETAIYWLRKAVEQGYAPGQYHLANMHYYGNGSVPKDYEQAIYLYNKAAEQGFKPAQRALNNINLIINGTTNSVCSTKYHTVQRGENLYEISEYYGNDYNDYKNLAKWNNINPPYNLQIGQRLLVCSTEWIGSATNNTTSYIQSSPAHIDSICSTGYHIVQRGENLYRIAKRYGNNYEDVARWNGISDGTISLGQRLLVCSIKK